MSGVPLLARISASLESRLQTPSSSSSSRRQTGICRSSVVAHASTTARATYKRGNGTVHQARTIPHCFNQSSLLGRDRRHGHTVDQSSEPKLTYSPPNIGGGLAVEGDSTSSDDSTSSHATSSDASIASINSHSDSYHYRFLQHSLAHNRSADVLKAVLAVSDEALASIPDTTFSEITSQIRPDRLIKWANVIRENFSPLEVKQMGLPHPDDVIYEYALLLIQLVRRRKATGRRLNVNDYASLLEITFHLRNKSLARVFWNAMQEDSISPDLRCFNAYLGAVVQNLQAHTQTAYRVTPFHNMIRSDPKHESTFKYSTYNHGESGIKHESLGVLEQILQGQNSPDAETFRLVILGVAREGDLNLVNSILRNVWRIDVPALMQDAASTRRAPRTDMRSGFPIYPNSAVLHAIAHAFAINNDMSTALRVVDAFSYAFNLIIPMSVWEELFNWTFVLAMPRHGQDKFSPDQIPTNSVRRFWFTMTSRPYSVKPSMAMYNRMIKMCFAEQRTQDMWRYMQEAKLLYEQTLFKNRHAFEKYERAHLNYPQGSMDKRRMQVAITYLMRRRSHMMMKRWVRLLLGSMKNWHSTDKDQFWSTVQIPAFIDQWSPFVPSMIDYEIPGGEIRIRYRKEAEMVASHLKRYSTRHWSQRRLNASRMATQAYFKIGLRAPKRLKKTRISSQGVVDEKGSTERKTARSPRGPKEIPGDEWEV